MLAATLAVIRDALGDGHGVEGLAFSGAMHSLIGLDAHEQPITPLLTWADARAGAQARRLRRDHPQLHARTGTPVHPMSPLVKLVWFAEAQPELFARVRRWAGIKELVVRRLTGEWVIDASCASGTGLMSLERGDWDPEALALAGVSRDQLSIIVGTERTLPLASRELGLASGTPVVVGGGDGPLANLGVGAIVPGVAACSIGTSGALRLTVARSGVDPAARLFCYALTPERWVVGGAINNGGSVLEWAGRALAPDVGRQSPEALLALAATVAPGSEGLVMLPYLLGERAPRWGTLARGAYVGLRHVHERPHLIRAALEGVCLQLALVLASMRAAGHDVREIRATGGFAHSALWRQMLSDVLGVPIGFPAVTQGSAFGAALLGLHALGALASLDAAAELVTIAETVTPEPSASAVYAELLPLFSELYDELTPAFERLADVRSPGAPPEGGVSRDR